MNTRDLERLGHMREEAEKAQSFLKNRSREELDSDELLAYGVRHALQIIGEAAAQIAKETRAEHPEIRWKDIIGMRQWIVHVYERLENEIIWRTVTEDLAPLIEQIDQILAALPPDQGT